MGIFDQIEFLFIALIVIGVIVGSVLFYQRVYKKKYPDAVDNNSYRRKMSPSNLDVENGFAMY